jgi:hypothetical protein
MFSVRVSLSNPVVPTKVGTQRRLIDRLVQSHWIPTFVGMTLGVGTTLRNDGIITTINLPFFQNVWLLPLQLKRPRQMKCQLTNHLHLPYGELLSWHHHF